MTSFASTAHETPVHYFPEIISLRSEQQAHKPAYSFFGGGQGAYESLTFFQVWQQAVALASVLQEQGLSGQRVLLVCISQQQFVVAFFAILLAGAIAVPTSVPRQRHAVLERFRLMVEDSEVRAILYDCAELDNIESTLDHACPIKIDLRQWHVGQDYEKGAAAWRAPVLGADSVAFLQYTSGSTGTPKGVIVTHRNLVENCTAISVAMAINEEAKILTALPLFHDMGLIGGVMQSMFSGCTSHFLSPSEFVQYPERWLKIISEHKITISGGPNFMYGLATKVITDEDLSGIDLSSWQVAFSGAEPIRPQTVQAFIERFGPYGFDAGAFYPCYGMAESTLFITGRGPGGAFNVGHHRQINVVSCGVPFHDTRIAIVDPDTKCLLEDDVVGEIWITGSSVASGYWRRAELSEQVFQAQMLGDTARYLRTGDLGFRRNGELYVTGRLKDLIILNARKFAPQDIEDIAESCHPALRSGGGAAFTIQQEESERLVLVFELNREWLRKREHWQQVETSVRAGINQLFGVPIHDLVWIKPGALPRTSSGKVRRSQCKSDYLTQKLALAL